MEKEKRNEIYELAIKKWGELAQLEMAQEEATELALAVRKHVRKNNEASLNHLAEEIADVEIMIEQITFMHNHLDFRKMIDLQKLFKLNRLINRIDGNYE